MEEKTWEQIKAEAGRQVIAAKIYWTKGYITALEDLLRETSVLRPDHDPNAKNTKAQRHLWYGEVSMHKRIHRVAGHRLHLARQNLSALNRIKNGDV